jgi:hypothetical protein
MTMSVHLKNCVFQIVGTLVALPARITRLY